MLVPHIVGFSFVASDMSFSSARQSVRLASSSIAAM